MTDKHVDKAKGRVKEAAGALTGNRRLKNEGRVDQAKSSVKNAVDTVADTLTRRKEEPRRPDMSEPTSTEPWEVTHAHDPPHHHRNPAANRRRTRLSAAAAAACKTRTRITVGTVRR